MNRRYGCLCRKKRVPPDESFIEMDSDDIELEIMAEPDTENLLPKEQPVTHTEKSNSASAKVYLAPQRVQMPEVFPSREHLANGKIHGDLIIVNQTRGSGMSDMNRFIYGQ